MSSLNFDSDVPLHYGSSDGDESFGASASEDAAADGGATSAPAEPAGEPAANGPQGLGLVVHVALVLQGPRDEASLVVDRSGGRRAWHTTVDEEVTEYDQTETFEYEAWEADAKTVVEPEAEYDDVVYDEEDDNYETTGQEPAAEEGADAGAHDTTADSLSAVVEALTVTSKRLAELTKSRGYYQDKGKGKPGGGKPSKGKGKGKSKDTKGKSKGKGKGKPSPTPSKGNLAHQKKALDESLCLGCLSPGHWLRDCPHANTYTAQLTSAGSVLDAEGNIVDHSSWMVTCTPSV
ncbi:unnamed protein product [Cladocopium goreaui]|uniref:Retrovirus-related Pol polyprotein from transposon TNT 1-94 n=1 Tax=Cladocopium goreaui TaxID=2562237 RepID=A0A9P1D8V9_9DINO|nr:unnamed protein product [Cladocopium goreaui]